MVDHTPKKEDQGKVLFFAKDVTTAPTRLSESSYKGYRITLGAEESHRADRRAWIGHSETIGDKASGFEINLTRPHIVHEDPEKLFIVGDNAFKIYVQLEKV